VGGKINRIVQVDLTSLLLRASKGCNDVGYLDKAEMDRHVPETISYLLNLGALGLRDARVVLEAHSQADNGFL
jgi:hypothetical protein